MAVYKEDIVKIDVKKTSIQRGSGMKVLGMGDTYADKIGVSLYDGNNPVDLTGAICSGYFIRPDGGTVSISGSVSGNTAYVILPNACYVYEGQYALAIKVAQSGSTDTMRVVDGYVRKTTTDDLVDPGTILPSIESLINAINSAVATIPPDYSNLVNEVGDLKSATRKNVIVISASNYVAGSYNDDGSSGSTYRVVKTSPIIVNVGDAIQYNPNNFYVRWILLDSSGTKVEQYPSDASWSKDPINTTFAHSGTLYISVRNGYNAGNCTDISPSDIDFDINVLFHSFDGVSVKEITSALENSVVATNDLVGYQMTFFNGNFAIGGLNIDGSLLASQKYRVSSDTPILLDYDISITPKSGFRFGYVIPNTETWSGWIEQGSATIPAGTTFALQLARVTENVNETADIAEFVSSFYVAGKLVNDMKTSSMASNSFFIDASDFSRGSLTANGSEDNSESALSTRIRSGYISLIKAKMAYCPFSYSVKEYDKYGAFLRDSGWIDDGTSYEFLDTAKTCRIVVRKTGNAQISDADIPNLAKSVMVVQNLLAIASAIPSTAYAYSYEGEKFEPALGFNSQKIITISYSGAQYTLNDIALYGDYIFFCLNPGTIYVYQYSTKQKVAELVVGTQHFACVAFSNEFYDENDPFPLMYADTTIDGIYDVIRFTAIDTASVVKKYKFNTDLYGNAPQVSFDFANERAYAVCDDVSTSNQYILFTFDMSNETANEDGTYSFAELSSGSFPFYQTRQGNTFHKGRMFMAFANTSSPYNPKVVAFDCSSGDAVIASEFNHLPFTDEAEGLDIYPIDGKYHMFVTNYYDLFELTF